MINVEMDPDTKVASYHIKIVNANGTVVKESESEHANWHANVSNLQPGNYLVQVTSNKDKKLIGLANFVKN